MTDATGTDHTDPAGAVVIPAGRPIEEAAVWVGHACWAELRLHQALTGWLAIEADDEQRVSWWRLRSHRAELAEAWHRRLPELRELPRPGLVLAGSPEVEARYDRLAQLLDATGTRDRIAALGAALGDLAQRYRDHRAVAVGPADAPVAATLASAIERTEHDAAALGADAAEVGVAPSS
ncbi:hypothetical protein BH23ACT2_BH23ACT2_22220 [soil metagenome]